MHNQELNFRFPLFCATAAALVVLAAGIGVQSQALALQLPKRQDSSQVAEERVFLNQYCVTCHNQKLKTAGLTLDTVDLSDVYRNGKILEKLVRKLESGTMPPAAARRPDKAAASEFLTLLEASLDHASAVRPQSWASHDASSFEPNRISEFRPRLARCPTHS